MFPFPVLAGLSAGFIHVLAGPDHMAAIAPLSTGGEKKSWRAGFTWGLGHSAGAIFVGIIAIVLKDLTGIEILTDGAEIIVGFMLIAIGLWGITQGGKVKHNKPASGKAFLVGTVHGVAGGSHILGVLPALAFVHVTDSALYLLFFAVGTIFAMTLFASAIGLSASKLSAYYDDIQSKLLRFFSIVAIVTGACWIGLQLV